MQLCINRLLYYRRSSIKLRPRRMSKHKSRRKLTLTPTPKYKQPRFKYKQRKLKRMLKSKRQRQWLQQRSKVDLPFKFRLSRNQ